jgi:hypothetical protein
MAASGSEARAARVFFYDARMVLALANHARYLALNRLFGVSRDQANLLTGVFLIGSAEATYATAKRAFHSPIEARDASLAALALQEAALALGGPAARRMRGFAPLVALALVGGVALPSVRRGIHGARMAEQHLRERRMRAFEAMRRATTLD